MFEYIRLWQKHLYITNSIHTCRKLIPNTLRPLKIDILALRINPVAPEPYIVTPKFWNGSQELGPLGPDAKFSARMMRHKAISYIFLEIS